MSSGFTLIEVVLGAMTLAVAIAAILGAYLGQLTLNEHARNISLAVHDANRVIEQMRQENTPCTVFTSPLRPEIVPAVASWNAWMDGAGGPKSLPNAAAEERIVVTCQRADGTASCPANQMGTEWHAAGPAGLLDPLRVTVAVCWRHRERVIGECAWNGAALNANDTDADGVIESPAMLTTLVTCRG